MRTLSSTQEAASEVRVIRTHHGKIVDAASTASSYDAGAFVVPGLFEVARQVPAFHEWNEVSFGAL